MNAVISRCVVVLPWPDSSLLPNRSSGHHWAVKQTAKQAARLTAISKAQDFNIGDVTVDHAVTIILEPPDRRKHDVDGVLSALKPSLDGIAASLGIDDFHFNPITIIRAEQTHGGRVTVRIDDAIPF